MSPSEMSVIPDTFIEGKRMHRVQYDPFIPRIKHIWRDMLVNTIDYSKNIARSPIHLVVPSVTLNQWVPLDCNGNISLSVSPVNSIIRDGWSNLLTTVIKAAESSSHSLSALNLQHSTRGGWCSRPKWGNMLELRMLGNFNQHLPIILYNIYWWQSKPTSLLDTGCVKCLVVACKIDLKFLCKHSKVALDSFCVEWRGGSKLKNCVHTTQDDDSRFKMVDSMIFIQSIITSRISLTLKESNLLVCPSVCLCSNRWTIWCIGITLVLRCILTTSQMSCTSNGSAVIV